MPEEKSHSIDSVIKFLESARESKTLKFNTARTRITALRKLKSYLSDIEQRDFTKINKEGLAQKLREKGKVNEGTIQTYLTRLDKSISSYKINQTQQTVPPDELMQPAAHVVKEVSKETLAIAIDHVIVRITNLPSNLSMEQAEKICMVVKDFAREGKNG